MAKIKAFFFRHIFELGLVFGILVVSVSLILVFSLGKDKGCVASITYNGEVIKEIDLDKEGSERLLDVYLHNDVYITVEVKKGAIRVVRAGCKHQDCVRMGWTSSPSKPIVCLDLNYKITLSGKDSVDVVVKWEYVELLLSLY